MPNVLQRALHTYAKVRSDFVEFLHLEVAGGLFLLVATAAALAIANSPLHAAFEAFWHTEVGIEVGAWHFGQSLLHWLDDGLMALFFFVVGLEIKREVIVGELSSPRKAVLPILAAIGGMLVPALLYASLNSGGGGAGGWGVPMATDIAFALGALALLGSRVPSALKVFLAAFAIADDIGAIFVIALFYSGGVSFGWLAGGLVLVAGLYALNRLRVDAPLPYVVLGTLVWFCFLNSGIHATIAGVLVALTIPAESRLRPLEFVGLARKKLDEIEACEVPGAHVLADAHQQHCAFELRSVAQRAAAPLQRLEHALLPITTFVILPLFALGNAGVRVVGGGTGSLLGPVSAGVVLGLVVGKPLGIVALSWLGVRLGLAGLPSGVTWNHVAGAGMLGGIGFTMSLFVTNLAFGDPALAGTAKLAVLVASALAGTLGLLWLGRASPGAEG